MEADGLETHLWGRVAGALRLGPWVGAEAAGRWTSARRGRSAEPLFWGCVTHPFLSVLYFLLSAFPLMLSSETIEPRCLQLKWLM